MIEIDPENKLILMILGLNALFILKKPIYYVYLRKNNYFVGHF